MNELNWTEGRTALSVTYATEAAAMFAAGTDVAG